MIVYSKINIHIKSIYSTNKIVTVKQMLTCGKIEGGEKYLTQDTGHCVTTYAPKRDASLRMFYCYFLYYGFI